MLGETKGSKSKNWGLKMTETPKLRSFNHHEFGFAWHRCRMI
jgi:hypothetical protein